MGIIALISECGDFFSASCPSVFTENSLPDIVGALSGNVSVALVAGKGNFGEVSAECPEHKHLGGAGCAGLCAGEDPFQLWISSSMFQYSCTACSGAVTPPS